VFIKPTNEGGNVEHLKKNGNKLNMEQALMLKQQIQEENQKNKKMKRRDTGRNAGSVVKAHHKHLSAAWQEKPV
jgi:hypothetical protein